MNGEIFNKWRVFDGTYISPSAGMAVALEDGRIKEISDQPLTAANAGIIDAAIYDRLELPIDAIVPGPAVFGQQDGTVSVDAGLTGGVDSFSNLVMTPGDQSGKTT